MHPHPPFSPVTFPLSKEITAFHIQKQLLKVMIAYDTYMESKATGIPP